MRKRVILIISFLIVILFGGRIFYTELSRYGAHFGVDYIKIEGKTILGQISNLGNQNVEHIEIVAWVKDKNGKKFKVRIPIDAANVEVGESTSFIKKVDIELNPTFIQWIVRSSSSKN
jgi:hypothetical protein